MIKKNVLTLYKALISEGHNKEARWIAMLYLTAGYDDDWRNTIDYLSKNKKYPFASWFPDGKDRVIHVGVVVSSIAFIHCRRSIGVTVSRMRDVFPNTTRLYYYSSAFLRIFTIHICFCKRTFKNQDNKNTF